MTTTGYMIVLGLLLFIAFGLWLDYWDKKDKAQSMQEALKRKEEERKQLAEKEEREHQERLAAATTPEEQHKENLEYFAKLESRYKASVRELHECRARRRAEQEAQEAARQNDGMSPATKGALLFMAGAVFANMADKDKKRREDLYLRPSAHCSASHGCDECECEDCMDGGHCH